jgi:hypothetical protein
MEKMMETIGGYYQELQKQENILSKTSSKQDRTQILRNVNEISVILLGFSAKIDNLELISMKDSSLESFAVYFAAVDLRNSYWIPTNVLWNEIKIKFSA